MRVEQMLLNKKMPKSEFLGSLGKSSYSAGVNM
jgi:hypothetical protein